ncbi:MAG: phosphosulfolactate synthase [Anaerolineales bacterium]|nr:phosphosulfolactate synthase [Anaerolineales bacterium]
MKAWAGVFPGLGARSRKPRTAGLTMVIDKGQGPHATADLLAQGADYLDHWKLSFGTSALLDEDDLRAKIALIKQHGILTYPGGTLTEYALVRGKCREFFERARELGFNAVEVSDGTIELSAPDRHAMINCAHDLGLAVVAEVGKKDPRRQPQARVLAALAQADFEAGADWVIVEARESGKGVGVYDSDGRVTEYDVGVIAAALDTYLGRLIWEAPLKSQQEYFILRFGPDVNLGNIQPHELLGLEALRAGLRFETFKPLVEQMEHEGSPDIPSLSDRVARMARRRLPEA